MSSSNKKIITGVLIVFLGGILLSGAANIFTSYNILSHNKWLLVEIQKGQNRISVEIENLKTQINTLTDSEDVLKEDVIQNKIDIKRNEQDIEDLKYQKKEHYL